MSSGVRPLLCSMRYPNLLVDSSMKRLLLLPSWLDAFVQLCVEVDEISLRLWKVMHFEAMRKMCGSLPASNLINVELGELVEFVREEHILFRPTTC